MPEVLAGVALGTFGVLAVDEFGYFNLFLHEKQVGLGLELALLPLVLSLLRRAPVLLSLLKGAPALLYLPPHEVLA